MERHAKTKNTLKTQSKLFGNNEANIAAPDEGNIVTEKRALSFQSDF